MTARLAIRLFSLLLPVTALLLAACDSGLTDTATTAEADGLAVQPQKTLICHVGNELPEYDPACDPGTETCGDAGKVDLIEVSSKAQDAHLGENTSHCYDEKCDYRPEDVGASGEGGEDSDGNGIDEGCEIPAVDCPCWPAVNGTPWVVSGSFRDRACDEEFNPDVYWVLAGYVNGTFYSGYHLVDVGERACIREDSDAVQKYEFANLSDAELAACFDTIYPLACL